MTDKKPKEDRKRKRFIPTRQPGAVANAIYDHPADDLFAEAFGKKDLVNQIEDEKLTKNVEEVNQNDVEKLTKDIDLVNQNSEQKLTKFENLDYQTEESELTKNGILVKKLTSDDTQTEQKVNKLTKKPRLVNQKIENSPVWKEYERSRPQEFSDTEGFKTSAAFKQRIKVFCAEHEMKKQDFYHLAAMAYMENVVNQNSEDLVNNLTLEERRIGSIYKTAPRIINLYREYSQNPKWKPSDDAKAYALSEVHFFIIEIGIIHTMSNRALFDTTDPIRSFNYFMPEIEKMVNVQNLTTKRLATVLHNARNTYKTLTGKSPVPVNLTEEEQKDFDQIYQESKIKD